MKVAILTAILGGSFDKPVDPVKQDLPEGIDEVVFHRFTDKDFPPITGLTPRLQYRIPKLFGYEMFPGYDYYIWLDGSVSLQRPDCVKWYLEQLGEADMAFFRHPQRGTMREEVEHIEQKLKENSKYIVSRYKNGLHKEQLNIALFTEGFEDKDLYASTAFIYKNNVIAKETLIKWWYLQSRYYTCDQVNLPLAMYYTGVKVNKIKDNLFKIGYLSLVSKHK